MGKLLIDYGHLPNKCLFMDIFLTLFQPSIKFCGFKTLLIDIFLTLFQPNMWISNKKHHAQSPKNEQMFPSKLAQNQNLPSHYSLVFIHRSIDTQKREKKMHTYLETNLGAKMWRVTWIGVALGLWTKRGSL